MPPQGDILIVGASTRAAAFSALRAGLRPLCLDLFADADLAARCPVARLDPDGALDPPACDAWLYTGSMEARPGLVGRLARVAPLLGNGPDVLRRARDPWAVADALTAEGLPTPRLRRVGAALARRFALVGLFGVDFVLADGRPWVVEVNPRYTASVELFEYAARRPLMRDHVRACVDRQVDAEEIRGGEAVGKRVIYAGRRLTFPEIAPPSIEDDSRPPDFADVPHPGSIIEAGEPILTVFARAGSPEDCVARLDRAETAWVERLGL